MSLSDPLTLPCGLVFQNRLVKAAMAEQFSYADPQPNEKHSRLYKQWAQGGWGAMLTGNIQVDHRQLGFPGEVGVDIKADANSKATELSKWKRWAEICQAEGTPTIAQLNHPGRQCPIHVRKGQPIAPSSVPMRLGTGLLARAATRIVYGTPREMTPTDIEAVIGQFVHAAKLAYESGFKGVELHAAHGYLFSQFLSPKTNLRTDKYGGSPENRARFVREVVSAIRAVTPAEFCVGLKMNSADHQHADGMEDSLRQIAFILEEKVDFLEVSGGTHENPQMMGTGYTATGYNPDGSDGGLKPTENTAKREAFFAQYAIQVRARFPSLVLLLTGGFRSRAGMQKALDDGACDLIGVGRPATIYTAMPKDLILNKDVDDERARVALSRIEIPFHIRMTGIKPLGAGRVTAHYQNELEQRVKVK